MTTESELQKWIEEKYAHDSFGYCKEDGAKEGFLKAIEVAEEWTNRNDVPDSLIEHLKQFAGVKE